MLLIITYYPLTSGYPQIASNDLLREMKALAMSPLALAPTILPLWRQKCQKQSLLKRLTRTYLSLLPIRVLPIKNQSITRSHQRLMIQRERLPKSINSKKAQNIRKISTIFKCFVTSVSKF